MWILHKCKFGKGREFSHKCEIGEGRVLPILLPTSGGVGTGVERISAGTAFAQML